MLMVQFVDTSVPPYNAGEQASLPDDLANDLVAKNRALPIGWSPIATTEAADQAAVASDSAGVEAEIQAAKIDGAL
jgi:hypothetical protein